MENIDKDQLEQVVKSRADDDRITCETALGIATELGVSPADVGKVLNKLGIKVRRCQLGCF